MRVVSILSENPQKESMDNIETSDVVVPETTATIGQETATSEPAVNENLSAIESEPAPEDVELDAEIDKQVAEKPEDVDDLKHFRQLLRNKEKQVRELSKKTPEYSDTDREAIDLYNGLFAFDTAQGVPTSKDFAQKLVAKDKDLALNASWDIATQQLDESGLTVGHLLLQKMGLDPYRLEELREFSQGKIKGDAYGMVEVPEFVPQEVAGAYKLLSQPMRDNVDFMLESGDPVQKQSALETLQDKQSTLEFKELKQRQEHESVQRTQMEITQAVDSHVTQTFTDFTNGFKDTPTYKTATISGNPQFDSGVKGVVSLAILGLSEPDSVMGKQSQQFFQELGVNVNPTEVSTLVNSVIQDIEAAEKAGKGNFTTAKTEALKRKEQSMMRATGVRNRIFAETMTKLAATMKAVSEGNGQKLDANGGMPSLAGNGASTNGAQAKVSTLDLIKTMTAK